MPDRRLSSAVSRTDRCAERVQDGRLSSRGSCPARKRGSNLYLTWVFLILMLGLIAFAIYQCARHLTVNLNTLRTQEITETAYCDLTLYLFRDEETVAPGGGNVFLYDVRDGEKVRAGAALGNAYVSMDGDGVAALQRRLNLLGAHIWLLNEASSSPAGATVAMAQTERHYLKILAAVSAGNLEVAAQENEQMLAAMEAYRRQAGEAGETTGVSVLREERNQLVSGLTRVGEFISARAGWFCYTFDGMETEFTPERAQSMTAEEFLSLIERADAADLPRSYGIAGKVVGGSQWFAGALIPSDASEAFQEGRDYRVLCGDADESTLTLTCYRVVQSGEKTLLVFSSSDMPEWLLTERRITVQAVLDSVSGYRVPEEALVKLPSPTTGKEVTGVYILAGNRVEFRRVRIVAERDGYIIVMTDTQAKAELEDETTDQGMKNSVEADGWAFLKLNDRIITGGNNLYEGKTIA